MSQEESRSWSSRIWDKIKQCFQGHQGYLCKDIWRRNGRPCKDDTPLSRHQETWPSSSSSCSGSNCSAWHKTTQAEWVTINIPYFEKSASQSIPRVAVATKLRRVEHPLSPRIIAQRQLSSGPPVRIGRDGKEACHEYYDEGVKGWHWPMTLAMGNAVSPELH